MAKKNIDKKSEQEISLKWKKLREKMMSKKDKKIARFYKKEKKKKQEIKKFLRVTQVKYKNKQRTISYSTTTIAFLLQQKKNFFLK